ncbi:MAG: hypothetical protein M3R07_07210 [Gemmatimonadota bacterium]|nr:hypothetical protein [Gemmatimonadota bacterium]
MAERHNSIREGIYAGFIGATAVALWFLIIDVVAGVAFMTPNLLGRGLISVLGTAMMPDSMIAHVIAYTIFHYVVFAIIGVLLAMLVHQSARTPAVLAGVLIAFVAFELAAFGFTTLISQSEYGRLAWYQIFIANLLGAGLMFWFMWRRHPRLAHDIEAGLAGTDDD